MVTVAPEAVTSAQIAALADAGIVVSLGHSDCSYAQAREAFASGARCVTHLFNAMSGFGSREPGLVGAALAIENVHTGLIADGIHVHPASMATALAAKPEAVFLVSDAMAPAGSSLMRFQLNGREITRKAGRLTLTDGTLAGADLSLPRAIAVLVGEAGIDEQRAIAMATSGPACVLPKPDRLGHFTGDAAQLNYLNVRTAECVPLHSLLNL
jgi:N-acetylglucosamine-6-phosphate deacetylase